MSLLRFESYRRGLAASTFFNLLAQIVGFLALLLFANYFGAQEKTDVYLFCAASVLTVAVLITSPNGAVAIPEMMRLEVERDQRTASRFFNCFFYAYLLAATLLAAAVGLFPVALAERVSGFDRSLLETYRPLLVLWGPMLMGEVAIVGLNNLLVARKFFTVPMFSTMLNRLIQILALLGLHRRWDIYAMPIGVLTAYVLQACLLIWLARSRGGWWFGVDPGLLSPRLLRNAGLAMVGYVFITLAQWVPLYLLSGLGAGAVSALNYALRIVNIPQNFLITQAGSVAGIRFNELFARGDFARINELFLGACRGLFFVLMPASALLFVLAEPVLSLLFERGSFDREATHAAAQFLKWLGLTLPLLAANTVVSRLFMSAQKVVPAFFYMSVQNLIMVGLVFAGVARYGAVGYAYAAVLFYLWNLVSMWPVVSVCFPTVDYSRALRVFAGLALLNGSIAALVAPLGGVLADHGSLVQVLGVTLVFGGILALVEWRFQLSPEVRAMWRGVLPGSEAGRG